jgi:hypothetical protein
MDSPLVISVALFVLGILFGSAMVSRKRPRANLPRRNARGAYNTLRSVEYDAPIVPSFALRETLARAAERKKAQQDVENAKRAKQIVEVHG